MCPLHFPFSLLQLLYWNPPAVSKTEVESLLGAGTVGGRCSNLQHPGVIMPILTLIITTVHLPHCWACVDVPLQVACGISIYVSIQEVIAWSPSSPPVNCSLVNHTTSF